mgnify:CR=1 FL=1
MKLQSWNDRTLTVGAIHTPISGAGATRGFTLIELIVTIAIVAILAGIAIPSFTSMIAKNRAAALTNELSGALNLAYSEAVKRSRRVTVCRSVNVDTATPGCSTATGTNWSTGWIVFVDAATTGTIDTGDTRLKIFQPIARSTSITGGSAFANYVSFLPTGWVDMSGSEESFIICVPPEKRTISINPAGRFKVDDSGTCS